jgi:Flp pilus assembly protein CpaB
MQPPSAPRRLRAVAFLAGSLVIGVLAVALIVTAMKRTERRALETASGIVRGGREGEVEGGGALPEGVVEVVVARRDLYVGMPVTEEDVGVRRYAAVVAPSQGVYARVSDVVGRTPRERILADEMVRQERLADPEAGTGLPAVLSPGRRGMTIATDTETGLAGLIQPGNHVDLIVTIPPDDPSAVGARWVSETILQNVKVLAVGGALDAAPLTEPAPTSERGGASRRDGAALAAERARSRAQKPSLTLEVDPVQAEKLAMALKRGEIRVSLRSDLDREQIWQEGLVTASELIGVPAPVAEPAPPPPRRLRRARRGIRRGSRAVAPSGVRRAEVIQGDRRSSVILQPDGAAVERVERRPGEP